MVVRAGMALVLMALWVPLGAVEVAVAAARSPAAQSVPVPGGGTSGSPFSPGVPQSTGAAPTTATAPAIAPTVSTTSTGGGLSGSNAVIIGVGAIIVLVGISLFIWRDARRRAPVRHRAATEAATAASRAAAKARAKPRKLSPAERRRRKRGRARR
jgi:hypothetical protein